MTERRQKINELKSKIAAEKERMLEIIKQAIPTDATEEQVKQAQEDRREKLAVIRVNVEGFNKELELTRMNKTGSKFFEWHPHKGMNRRQARNFRRQYKV